MASFPQDLQQSKWNAQIVAANAALEARDLSVADRLFTNLVEEKRAAGASDAPYATALLGLATVRQAQRECLSASGLISQAIGILQQDHDAQPGILAVYWSKLGSAYDCQHVFSKAAEAYERALDLGALDPSITADVTAGRVASLGMVYQHEGRTALAESTLNRARILLVNRTSTDPVPLALVLNNLAMVYGQSGRAAEAEDVLRRAIAALDGPHARAGDAPSSFLMVHLLGNFGMLQLKRKDYTGASESFARAVAEAEARSTVSPSELAYLLQRYSICLAKTGKKREAKTTAQKAKAILAALPRGESGGWVLDMSQIEKKSLPR